MQWWTLDDEGAAFEFNPISRFWFDDIDAIADAVVGGFGLTWLPYWLVQKRVDSGELVQVMPNLRPSPSDVWAVWPEGPHVPTRVRVAIDALAKFLPKLVPTRQSTCLSEPFGAFRNRR